MAIIIDGKALAAKCKEEVRTAVAAMEDTSKYFEDKAIWKCFRS